MEKKEKKKKLGEIIDSNISAQVVGCKGKKVCTKEVE